MLSENESFEPANQKDWRKWLKHNHIKKDAVWLIIHKKGTGNMNLTWSQAVDEALCFGWIDSVKRPIDSDKYRQYFAKRKPSSTWSKINKVKVDCFIKEKKMTEAGLQCIEIAKQNGSWTLLDSVEALVMPDALRAAFADNPGTLAYYESHSNSIKKQLLAWIALAKREETKHKRIAEIVEAAKEKSLPKHFS